MGNTYESKPTPTLRKSFRPDSPALPEAAQAPTILCSHWGLTSLMPKESPHCIDSGSGVGTVGLCDWLATHGFLGPWGDKSPFSSPSPPQSCVFCPCLCGEDMGKD